MKVVITGGAGFLGRQLALALLARSTLTGTSGQQETIDEMVLLDVAEGHSIDDDRIRFMSGDVSSPAVIRSAVTDDTASVFHLAAIVSGQAEAEFDLGMRINMEATRSLLEACRHLPHRQHAPRFVFASSVAVFGGAFPATVPDAFELNPQTSYGTQKSIGELLVNDYGRRGFVDARAYRLPTICVRPGKPNRAASSFASGIIREPLADIDSVCPVAPQTRMWVSSPGVAIANLIHGHELAGSAFGTQRALSLPGMTVSVEQMLAALKEVAGEEVAARVSFRLDEKIDKLVSSWPGAVDVSRALKMGFGVDTDFRDIIRAHIAASH